MLTRKEIQSTVDQILNRYDTTWQEKKNLLTDFVVQVQNSLPHPEQDNYDFE